MIRPLRQRHRIMITTLSVIIPTAFALGIASRDQIPLSSSNPVSAPVEISAYTELWSRSDIWHKAAIRTRLLRSISNPERLAIELISKKQIVRPDLLAYWVPRETSISDTLPDNAFLLGSFIQSAPVRFDLPGLATKQNGVLLLYSLADHEIVATSKPVTF
jgi:hypothetical protein